MDAKRFGEFLSEARERAGIKTKTDLASLAGVDISTIGKWEAGKMLPHPKMLQKISAPLGIPYEDLMVAAGYLKKDILAGGIPPADLPEAKAEQAAQPITYKEGKTLGSELTRIYRTKGLSTEELSRQAGVNKSFLVSILRGEEPKPSPEILRRLAEALSTPYATLAGLAGYIMKAEDAPESKAGMDAFWFRGEGLTEDDMVDILAIIETKERRRKRIDTK
jgi:transcriptional regulator with XRE-family HTH domain